MDESDFKHRACLNQIARCTLIATTQGRKIELRFIPKHCRLPTDDLFWL
jgi:hypothetical protein